jgi:hypothetical protein
MSKLVLALLSDDGKLEKSEEFDMSWVEQFNKEFQTQQVPFKKQVYEEELTDMTSYAILNGMVLTENDEQFRVDRTPLKAMIRRLFDYEQPKQQEASLSAA